MPVIAAPGDHSVSCSTQAPCLSFTYGPYSMASSAARAADGHIAIELSTLPVSASAAPRLAASRASTTASETDAASTVTAYTAANTPVPKGSQGSQGSVLRTDTLSPVLDAAASKSYTPLPSPGASQSNVNLTESSNMKATAGSGVAALTESLSAMSTVSKLAKVQSYLPTGTWITFTALQTWAFSIRPNDPPPTAADPSQQSNCNSHQRVALCAVIALGLIVSFASSFIKSFVFDGSGRRVLHPLPSGARVAHSVTDIVTGATFPYRTKNDKNVWPVTGRDGGWVRKGKYIKVMIFKDGCDVKAKGPMWERMSASIMSMASDVELVAKTDRDDPGFMVPPELPPQDALDTYFEAAVPVPVPHWKRALRGPNSQYLDFSPHVVLHAVVSLMAFASLSLFSTQVTKCIYPSIPDYLPGIAQTTMLGAISFLAAYVVDDQAVGMGQSVPIPFRDADEERGVARAEDAGIPPSLYTLVEGTVWARARRKGADGEPAVRQSSSKFDIHNGGLGVLPVHGFSPSREKL